MTCVVVAGVSGSGKSTVAHELAARLEVAFQDGDDLHPPSNVAKMSAGEPLTDADRVPWLAAIGEWLGEHPDGVVACSALRRAHRDTLRSMTVGLQMLMLHGDPELIRARQRDRQHFMPPELMHSQLAAFEPLAPDEPGMTADVADPVETIVATYVGYLADEIVS